MSGHLYAESDGPPSSTDTDRSMAVDMYPLLFMTEATVASARALRSSAVRC